MKNLVMFFVIALSSAVSAAEFKIPCDFENPEVLSVRIKGNVTEVRLQFDEDRGRNEKSFPRKYKLVGRYSEEDLVIKTAMIKQGWFPKCVVSITLN